ncbi:MAG TPA: hypothetical protein VH417_07785 [Vicinamibacterales bacterium]
MLTGHGFAFWLAAAAAGGQAAAPPPVVRCDPALAALFAPPRPQLGRYEVCVTPAPLEQVADPAWPREQAAPLDAFGSAGTYDRAAVARLYGAQRPTVARGWVRRDGELQSITLISPVPDATLTRLEPGTLIIRLIICCL